MFARSRARSPARVVPALARYGESKARLRPFKPEARGDHGHQKSPWCAKGPNSRGDILTRRATSLFSDSSVEIVLCRQRNIRGAGLSILPVFEGIEIRLNGHGSEEITKALAVADAASRKASMPLKGTSCRPTGVLFRDGGANPYIQFHCPFRSPLIKLLKHGS
jgi:hypothetical protein